MSQVSSIAESDTDAASLRLQVSVLQKQRLRLLGERDAALEELRYALMETERTQASLNRLREQVAECSACRARRTAKALAADW
jgi:hypothetical protein